MKAAEILRQLDANADTIRKMAIFDCHIEGTHSIVLSDDDALMVRLYVIPPGKFHACHSDWSLPFLYHSHRYNFVSGPVLGQIRNQTAEFYYNTVGEWCRYRFESPITGGEAVLEIDGRADYKCVSDGFIKQGDLYQMDAEEIHRVGFMPDPKTGWFVGQFFEFADRRDSSICYWSGELKGMEDFGKLYNKPTKLQMDELLAGLKAALLA